MTTTLLRPRWRLKGCPRCRGDLNVDYHDEWCCLQCGYTDTPRVEINVSKRRYNLKRDVLVQFISPNTPDGSA